MQSLRVQMNLKQQVVACAMVYFRRFYSKCAHACAVSMGFYNCLSPTGMGWAHSERHRFAAHNPFLIATVCMYTAVKVRPPCALQAVPSSHCEDSILTCH
jgi:hypothetical protein